VIVVTGAEERIEDLGSKNGTSVNGGAVHQPMPLRDGDRLVIGRVALTYRTSASSMSTETRASSVDAGPSLDG
jgi:pSer/pThr/pTyr-binding forkhead associated (FHA) protein